MFFVKNLFDPVAPEDGLRLWIGPVDLTRDLKEWCKVDRWLIEGSPSPELARWFDDHPGGWEFFRGKHHYELNRHGTSRVLRELSRRAMNENVTLLHGESDPAENAAVSLHQYLVELQAYCNDDAGE